MWNCVTQVTSHKGELIAGTVIDCKINPQFDLTSSHVRQEVATLIEKEDPLFLIGAEEQAAQHAGEEYAAQWEPQQPPVSVPAFPVFSEMNVESRGPCTPEQNQGLTPGHNVGQASAPIYGSPGFGNSVLVPLGNCGCHSAWRNVAIVERDLIIHFYARALPGG